MSTAGSVPPLPFIAKMVTSEEHQVLQLSPPKFNLINKSFIKGPY